METIYVLKDNTPIVDDNICDILSFLHLRTFKTPPKGAVMSDEGDADWASSMPNGVNDESCFTKHQVDTEIYAIM